MGETQEFSVLGCEMPIMYLRGNDRSAFGIQISPNFMVLKTV